MSSTTATRKVTCHDCQSSRVVSLTTSVFVTTIDWQEDGQSHNIISFRHRLDGNLGWQCRCGNNDLLTPQEALGFSNPAAPTTQELADIVANLKVYPPRFTVE